MLVHHTDRSGKPPVAARRGGSCCSIRAVLNRHPGCSHLPAWWVARRSLSSRSPLPASLAAGPFVSKRVGYRWSRGASAGKVLAGAPGSLVGTGARMRSGAPVIGQRAAAPFSWAVAHRRWWPPWVRYRPHGQSCSPRCSSLSHRLLSRTQSQCSDAGQGPPGRAVPSAGWSGSAGAGREAARAAPSVPEHWTARPVENR